MGKIPDEEFLNDWLFMELMWGKIPDEEFLTDWLFMELMWGKVPLRRRVH